MNTIWLFIAASTALILTPGPDVIYVLTRGAAGGSKIGAASAVGVTGGILVHTIAASLGLTVLLQASPIAFWTMKTAGGLYLVFLGVQMIRHRREFELKRSDATCSASRSIVQGFLSNVFNPKVALFFVSFLPQFVDPSVMNPRLYLLLLGLIFAAMTLGFLLVVGACAGGITNWLSRRKRAGEHMATASGAVLAVLGIRLLLPKSS